jgi:hypothetical protein
VTITPSLRSHVSEKASRFTESVIREMTREALQHGVVNLAQGFPDFAAPEEIKRAAIEAIDAAVNQYAITWGARDLRQALARKLAWYPGLEIDPEREVTVTCGSTEGMIATLMATVDPGEEVVVFEPYRHRRLRLPGRRGLCDAPGARGGRRLRPRVQLLPRPRRRRPPGALLFCKKDETLLGAVERLGKLA